MVVHGHYSSNVREYFWNSICFDSAAYMCADLFVVHMCRSEKAHHTFCHKTTRESVQIYKQKFLASWHGWQYMRGANTKQKLRMAV